MRPSLPLLVTLAVLSPIAALSLTWAAYHALNKSDDLMRRRDEVRAFVAREDPYRVPSMTYPPSAPPLFTPLVAPFGDEALRSFWLGLNLAALAVLCGAAVQLWGERWPAWLKLAFALAVVASR